VEPGLPRLGFAAGCLCAACLARFEVAVEENASVLFAGLSMGVAFSSHAAFRESHAWPLIWPLFGGALAVLVHQSGGKALRPLRGAWLGLRAGAVAGLLFLLVGMALIGYFGQVTIISRLDVLAIGALAGTGLSALGGGVAAALTRRR